MGDSETEGLPRRLASGSRPLFLLVSRRAKASLQMHFRAIKRSGGTLIKNGGRVG